MDEKSEQETMGEEMSETATARSKLAPFCVGVGLDLGFGGDPILPTAICIDRDEGSGARAKHPNPSPTHIVGDITTLPWFPDASLDYAFSSHVLEDFEDTAAVLKEWVRVLKRGGHLVLFLPDQPTYEKYCADKGLPPNKAHVHADFSLAFVKARLPENVEVIYEEFPFEGNPYSFALVCKRRMFTPPQ